MCPKKSMDSDETLVKSLDNLKQLLQKSTAQTNKNKSEVICKIDIMVKKFTNLKQHFGELQSKFIDALAENKTLRTQVESLQNAVNSLQQTGLAKNMILSELVEAEENPA